MTLSLFSRSLHYKDSKTEPCVHSVSWITRWNLTKVEQRHHWDWEKKWLDVGDLYLVFKSHRHFETQILIEKSLCAHYILNQQLEFYQTSADTSLGHAEEVIRFWWPWPHFHGHTGTVQGVSNKHCLLTLFSFVSKCTWSFYTPPPKKVVAFYVIPSKQFESLAVRQCFVSGL